ncbi:MAG: hypothetical protein JST59_00125 [Actinobacteria bacterium]|nr:hypothetical protein [Actinomycetota bacterium]
MNRKVQMRVKADAFKVLLWRRFFKQTSRDYVQTQLNRMDHELLRDCFLAMKHRHSRVLWACNRISASFLHDL